MEVKSFSKEMHYPIVSSWWESHKDWQPIPEDILPTTGFIVYDNELPCVAGWLYLTNSSCAWLEWIVSSPTLAKEQRVEGVHKLLDHVEEVVDSLGIKMTLMAATNPVLIKRLTDHGFTATEKARILIRNRR